jgi:outer membrane biosynthesis protein TonB
MYFDFGDGHPDLERIPRALSTREEVFVAIIIHLLLVIAILVVPRMPFMKARALAAEQARLAAVEAAQQRRREQTPFMFVQPQLDVRSKVAPPKAPPSDINRQAMTMERPPEPKNSQPFMRGNTTEFSEASRPTPRAGAQVQGPPTPPAPAAPPAQEQGPGAAGPNANALRLPDAGQQPSYTRENNGGGRPPQTGPLGEALRNLQRYANQAALDNPTGGNGAFGPSIQFDTKGVEFGPWIRRFIAQIKRNWFVPYAAMSLRGHTVMTFNVHKDGSITDLAVMAPSDIEAFNRAAYNALASSNPTADLPAEYPSDKAFFTVTFYYNEQPPSAISP